MAAARRIGKRVRVGFGALARRKALAVLATGSLVLLAAIIFVFAAIWMRQTSEAESVRADALWATYQIDREASRFAEVLDDWLDRRPDATLADLKLRFDILYSRHEVMEEGDFPAKFRSDPILTGLADEIASGLHRMIRVIDRIETDDPPDLAALAVARQQVGTIQILTGRLLGATNRVAGEILIQDRDQTMRDFRHLAVAVGALTVAVLAIIWLIWRQVTQLEVSRRRLQVLSEELKRSAEAANAGNRAKSAFLATMSHEIRTPLNGIVGMAELMAGECTDPVRHEKLETIRRCSEGLSGLIDDVLDFSRLESGSIELEIRPTVVGDVIEDVVDMSVPRIEGRDIAIVASHPLTAHLTDPTRLRQILANLVGNAIKFTECGTVSIVVRERRSRSRGTLLRFEVTDTGIGIDPETIGRLFGEFTQADASIRRRFGGSGLGLAISRRLVETFGGTIGVASTPGAGSTFWFEIPARRAEVQPPAAAGCRFDVAVVGERPKVDELLVHDLAELAAPVDAMLRDGRRESWRLVDVASYEADCAAGRVFDPTRTIVHGIGARRNAGEVAEVIEGAITTGRLARVLARISGRPLPARAGETVRPMSGPAAPGERGHVLVVEDNEVNRRVVVGLLARLGFTSEVAPDGAVAVERLSRPGIDLVLMDMQMPVMDGLDATARIRAEEGDGRRVPIIGLTANAFASDRVRCLEAGMDDFLVKPVTRDRLAAALDRHAPAKPEAMPPVAPEAATAVEAPAVVPSGLVDRARRRLLVEELDRDTLDELTRIFWNDAEGLGTALAEALAAGDLPSLRRHLHTLKGAAANVGLSGIVAAADRLRRSDTAPTAEDVGHLSAAMAATRLAQIAADDEIAAAA